MMWHATNSASILWHAVWQVVKTPLSCCRSNIQIHFAPAAYPNFPIFIIQQLTC